MMRSLRQFGVVLAIAVLGAADVWGQSSLGGAVGCFAVESCSDMPSLGVHDRAGLFHHDAVAKARAAIQQYRHDYHRDLFLETFAQVQAAEQKHVRSLSRRHREQYFADWAKTRAANIGVDGVYILICKEPKHVFVLIHPDMPEQAFNDDNTKELRKRLERQLPMDADSALEDAIVFVRARVEENLANRTAAAASIPFGTVVIVLGTIGGLWLLLSLIRAGMIWRNPATGNPAHVGLLAGFFAALFGTTAGHWIYDRVFHAHAPATPTADSEYLHEPRAS